MGHSLLSLLAPITHSQRYAQTASLARSAALIRSLAHLLNHSGADGMVICVHALNLSISYNFSPLCPVGDSSPRWSLLYRNSASPRRLTYRDEESA